MKRQSESDSNNGSPQRAADALLPGEEFRVAPEIKRPICNTLSETVSNPTQPPVAWREPPPTVTIAIISSALGSIDTRFFRGAVIAALLPTMGTANTIGERRDLLVD